MKTTKTVISALVVLALTLTAGIGLAIENPWILVCDSKPGEGEPNGNGLMTDGYYNPGAGNPFNGAITNTWAQDSDNAAVNQGWTSYGKGNYVYLRALSLGTHGEPGFQVMCPDPAEAFDLMCLVTFYIVDGSPMIFFGSNSATSYGEDFGRCWDLAMSWSGGRIKTVAKFTNVPPGGPKTYLTVGQWQFRVVRYQDWLME